MTTKNNSLLPHVIYEDEWLIAFDKPSGMLVAPDRWNKDRGCLVDLVHQEISPDAFNVHRIDAHTSGLVLFAKWSFPIVIETLKAIQIMDAELDGKAVQAVIARPTADQQRILDLLKVTL